ncbi:TetR/AcrR family transcriptional regulator [Corynebacterium sp.]|uniref:TetR/AcrR family transcriptional regulator n=1 Tax=Corynebacterium sp. TaxID=1720 RepID=UPI0025BBE444|nr:TetR/AcrR family transcriptional regulator [Corynebacterium sp.]
MLRPEIKQRQAGRRPQFSSKDCVDAAIRLGVSDFTMASVARELSVTPSAMYRAFASHRDLREACLDRILEVINPPPSETSWQSVLFHASEEWTRACREFPGLDNALLHYDGPVARFIQGGFTHHVAGLKSAGYNTEQSLFAVGAILVAATYADEARPMSEADQDDSSPSSLRRPSLVSFVIRGLSADWPECAPEVFTP